MLKPLLLFSTLQSLFINHCRSAEDAENVLRLNLDLRVEVETMRKELQEKDKLLRVSRLYFDLTLAPNSISPLLFKDAYNAMETLDTERLRERTELESQLNSLRQTHLDSQVRRHTIFN